MNPTVSKGLKPFIFKVIILAMSLLYLFGPVHVEVNKLLHTIVHSLEMPDQVLTHQENSQKNIHKSEHHKGVDTHHDHEIITLLNKILEGSDQNNTDSDAFITHHKLDKHINNYTYTLTDDSVFVPQQVKHNFSEKEKRICKGYLRGFREPPKSRLHTHV